MYTLYYQFRKFGRNLFKKDPAEEQPGVCKSYIKSTTDVVKIVVAVSSINLFRYGLFLRHGI